VIAAVNGYCLGYGLTLVTWCDFVIASERAEFGFPEVRIGVPTIVGAIRLPQRIGWQRAMELLLTGERIDAARAKEIGLAGWVVPHDELLDEANALADRLCRPRRWRRATKEVAMRSAPVDARGDPLRRDDAQGRGATDDAAEGMRAAAAVHRSSRQSRLSTACSAVTVWAWTPRVAASGIASVTTRIRSVLTNAGCRPATGMSMTPEVTAARRTPETRPRSASPELPSTKHPNHRQAAKTRPPTRLTRAQASPNTY
jgi:hypothetical protein